MAALDGKITIEKELRPCIVHIPEKRKNYQTKGDNLNVYDKVIEPDHDIKALFHCWHPVTGNAVIEYEDGTINEVYPTQIRFVDNAMSEYAFPKMEDKNGN